MKQYRKTYSDSNVGSWNKTNQSCQKENMKWYVDNWRCQIDKKVGQRRSYSQKEHVIQQLFPALCYLNARNQFILTKRSKLKSENITTRK